MMRQRAHNEHRWNARPLRLAVAGLLLASSAPTYGAESTIATGPETSREAHDLWFSMSSPWNRKIEKNAAEASYGRATIESLVRYGRNINMNTNSWTPAVIIASPENPRQTVQWGNWTLDGVPITDEVFKAIDFFKRTRDSDRSLCIYDAKQGLFFNLFAADYETDEGSPRLTAKAGALYKVDGSGWWDNSLGPWAGRASGASFCGGVVRQKELQDGVIRHALAAAWPKELIRSKAHPGFAVLPATTSDGSGGPDALPMGSLLQLNPDLTEDDLKAYGLSKQDLAVARAMQQYGVYIVDSSSVMAVYFESGLGSGRKYGVTSPWPHDLISQFRVLAPAGNVELDTRYTMGQPLRAPKKADRSQPDAARPE